MATGTETNAILLVGAADRELSARLGEELTDFNIRTTGIDDQSALSVRVTDAADELVGGLSGWTWGGCAAVDQLWVHTEHRRQGWGSRMLRAAEDEARRRGCTRMVASSLTFQAPAFYRQHGYVETGRTEGLPGGHAGVHFWKPLDDSAGEPRVRAVVLVDLNEESQQSALRTLLARHGGRLDQRLRTWDSRTEVHHLSFTSPERYAAYRAELVNAEISVRALEVDEVRIRRVR